MVILQLSLSSSHDSAVCGRFELAKMIHMLLEGFNSISGCWSVCTYNVIKQQVLVVIIFVESFVFVQLCNCLYRC